MHPYAYAGAFLVVLWLLYGVISGKWNPWTLVEGADGRPSTSKLQWFLWLIVISFAYVAVWAARVMSPIGAAAISDIPSNILTVLGLSSATMAAAKGITSSLADAGKVDKTPKKDAGVGNVVKDDDGDPDLSKMQLVSFTLIALAVYVLAFDHRVQDILALKVAPDVNNLGKFGLPDIDGSLMVLMGLSQAGYLGKKLTTSDTPRLTGLTPVTQAPGSAVTLKGLSFGTADQGNQLLLDGAPVATTSWDDKQVVFDIPAQHPLHGTWSSNGEAVKLSVVVLGQESANELTLSVK